MRWLLSPFLSGHRIVSGVFVIFALACAGDSTAPIDDNNTQAGPPQPTSVGTEIGISSTATIGVSGGSLTTADGTLTLTIPAGALTSSTDITIQPITNEAWGGLGTGYRLLPDGLTLLGAATLQFTLTPDDVSGSASQYLNVASQKPDNTWYVLSGRTFDAATRKLTAQTIHFSDYSPVSGVQIRPGSAVLDVNESIQLHVRICNQAVPQIDPSQTALYQCDDNVPYTIANWSANGALGGNATAGRVVAGSTTREATYTAPANAPQANPVAVSAQAVIRRSTLLLVSNITIAPWHWVGWADVFHSYGTSDPTVDGEWYHFTNLSWTKVGAAPAGLTLYIPDGGDVKAEIISTECPTLSLVPDTYSLDFVSSETKGTLIFSTLASSTTEISLSLFPQWEARYTYQCLNDGSNQPVTVNNWQVNAALGDAQGEFNADSSAIEGHFDDPVGGDSYHFKFTKERITPGPGGTGAMINRASGLTRGVVRSGRPKRAR